MLDGLLIYRLSCHVRGLFFRTEENFLPGALTCLAVYRPLYLRVFRAAVVRPEAMTPNGRVFYPIIVRCDENERRLLASCWSVEVVNGGNPEST